MSRNTKTIVSIASIIIIFFVISLIVYFIGSPIAKSVILKAGGINYSEWVKHYSGLVRVMGILSCLLTLLWYILTRFVIKIVYPTIVGRRSLWCLIGIINILLCIIVPFIYSIIDSKSPMSFAICLLFIVFFGVIGYYVCSVLFTPANYKYTPIGAIKIRKMKGGITK